MKKQLAPAGIIPKCNEVVDAGSLEVRTELVLGVRRRTGDWSNCQLVKIGRFLGAICTDEEANTRDGGAGSVVVYFKNFSGGRDIKMADIGEFDGSEEDRSEFLKRQKIHIRIIKKIIPREALVANIDRSERCGRSD